MQWEFHYFGHLLTINLRTVNRIALKKLLLKELNTISSTVINQMQTRKQRTEGVLLRDKATGQGKTVNFYFSGFLLSLERSLYRIFLKWLFLAHFFWRCVCIFNHYSRMSQYLLYFILTPMNISTIYLDTSIQFEWNIS